MKFELAEYRRNILDSELLQDVLRVQKIHGKDTLTREEYEEYGKYSRNTFCRHFGGWTQTLELCGLRVNDQQRHAAQGSHNYGHITDEQLKEDLIRVAKILGASTFSSGEYSKHGEWAVCTYFKRFKTWNGALKHAGLQPYAQVAGKKIEEGKLLAEIERIWVKLGRQPTTTDIKNGISIYSLHSFSRHFGGWRQALSAFVNYINEAENSTPVGTPPVATENNFSLAKANECKRRFIKHRTQRDPNLRLRFKVFQRDHFKCCICGASPSQDPSVELHVDHIKPWSRGGESVLENLQTLCSKCNLGKSDLL